MTRQVGIERVLYSLHRRVCTFSLRHTTSRTRRWLEHLWLVLAICGFGALILMHLCFVYRPNIDNVSTQCLRSIPGFTHQADVTHIVLLDQTVDRIEDAHAHANISSHAMILGESNPTCAYGTEQSNSVYDPMLNTLTNNGGRLTVEHAAKTETKTTHSCAAKEDPTFTIDDIYFSFSSNEAYLQLSPHDKLQQSLTTQYVFISPTDMNCFGEPFLQAILWTFVGPDTVMMNWLLAIVNNPSSTHHWTDQDGEGPFLYHRRSRRIQKVFVWERDSLNLLQRIVLLLQTSFLFLSTTTMISFTLRETQERMLEFTQELNRRVQGRQPVQNLVSSHVLQNLIFIPIMVGMLFFLIEFYGGDKFLAFLVMTIVWIAEVYSIISLRSFQGITFFPRIFFLLFCLFHVYHFAYPFGFGYTALGTITCFMLHSMLFFWHRYELPAVALGWVDASRPRMMTSSSEMSQQYNETRSRSFSSPSRQHNRQEERQHGSHQPSNPHVLRPSILTASSRQQSHSSGLFRAGVEEDDESSYMFFMGGEVVVRRPQSQSRSSPSPPVVIASFESNMPDRNESENDSLSGDSLANSDDGRGHGMNIDGTSDRDTMGEMLSVLQTSEHSSQIHQIVGRLIHPTVSFDDREAASFQRSEDDSRVEEPGQSASMNSRVEPSGRTKTGTEVEYCRESGGLRAILESHLTPRPRRSGTGNL